MPSPRLPRLLPLLILLLLPSPVRADRFGDVTVTLGDPIVRSGASYGAARIPVYLENESDQERRVRLSAAGAVPWSYSTRLRSISRTFVLPPNSRLVGELDQPPAVLPGGEVRVTIDGRTAAHALSLPIDTFHAVSSSSAWRSGTGETHAVLVGWAVQDGARAELELIAEASASARGRIVFSVDRARVENDWPDDWIAYTRLLGIVLTQQEWASLDEDIRAAILHYVYAGGGLAVVGADSPGDVAAALGPTIPASLDTNARLGFDVNDADTPGLDLLDLPPSRVGRLGLGTIVAPPQPERLDADLWIGVLDAWLRSLAPRSAGATVGECESILSMLDGREIPTRPLLAALFLFALVIGPLNMLLVARARKRVLLFVTTPALGAFFAALVFLYGVAHDGSTPIVKSRSVTLLDQRARLAATHTHLGYFAPFTPGAGLRFDHGVLVSPATRLDHGYATTTPVDLDLTAAQHFRSGLVEPRVAAHIRTLDVRPRRERIALERDDDGALVALNGLGAPIAALYLATDTGDLYEAHDLAPGQRARLRPRSAPGPDVGDWAQACDNASHWTPVQPLRRFHHQPPRGVVPRNGYVALVDGQPFSHTGLRSDTRLDAASVVVGALGEN